jgi:hypothetical protein
LTLVARSQQLLARRSLKINLLLRVSAPLLGFRNRRRRSSIEPRFDVRKHCDYNGIMVAKACLEKAFYAIKPNRDLRREKPSKKS